MSVMKKLWVLVTVMLALTALYYLATTLFKPAQPQVVVVKPSGAQNQPQTQTQTTPSPHAELPQIPTSVPTSFVCTKAVYLKVGTTSLCADAIYSVTKTGDALQVDFQGGIVQGVFTLISPCTVSTTPQGVFIPCRAQVIIPLPR